MEKYSSTRRERLSEATIKSAKPSHQATSTRSKRLRPPRVQLPSSCCAPWDASPICECDNS
eukprot:86431-Pleurochrysis_carterae.AAC.1